MHNTSRPDSKKGGEDQVASIPHAVGVEKSVLSLMMQFPENYGKSLQPIVEHFHIPAHRILFERILAAGQALDLVAFIQELLAAGLLDRVGGPAAVTEVHNYQPNPFVFNRHIEILEEYRRRRLMIEAAEFAKAAAYGCGDSSGLDESLRDFRELIGRAEGMPAGNSFPITKAGFTAGMVATADFVQALLIEGGASVIYGPSNCGKSFWILDLAVSVATGRDFRNELKVDQGAVVYVALEGCFGIQNRIEALKRAGRLDDNTPLFLCFAPVSLLEAGHAAKLAESVKLAAAESKLPCRLVILDTLARAMAGGDENSGQDMTGAVSAIDAIRSATGAHVCVVHHCGKDEARGARGHSSLRAAVDTEIEVSRPEGESISTVRITKQRDLPMGEPMPFSLDSVTIGTDKRGNPITSCIVHHEAAIMAKTPGKGGRKPTCTADDMLRFLPADSVKDWLTRVNDETGLGQSRFYTHKATLEAGGKVRREVGTNRLIRA